MSKTKIYLFALIMIFLMVSVSAEVNEYAPVKQNDCVLLKQVCSSCSYVNLSISYPNSTLSITNEGMSSVGGGVWTYNYCNTSQLGRYDVNGEGDIEGIAIGFNTLWFEVSESGELFNGTQGYVIMGQLGIIGLLLVIGFAFDKTKWKIRSFFFMVSLLMGIVTLNSIRIITGASTSLSSMGNVGLILGIIILAFMFLFTLINYTIEVFQYFKKKNIKRWEVDKQV